MEEEVDKNSVRVELVRLQPQAAQPDSIPPPLAAAESLPVVHVLHSRLSCKVSASRLWVGGWGGCVITENWACPNRVW